MRTVILFLFIQPAMSEENIQITTFVDSKESILQNKTDIGHIFGNITGFLSTCSRYQNVVGKPYNLNLTIMALEKMKSSDYLQLTISKQPTILPLKRENIVVEKIYVGFSENHLPIMFTVAGGKPQRYAKCMGSLGMKNFKCDNFISKLFNLDGKHPFCKN